MTARLSIWSSGFTVKKIPKVPREQALENGADIFAESIVVGVAMSILVVEYNLQSRKAEFKRSEELRRLEEKDIEMVTAIRVLGER